MARIVPDRFTAPGVSVPDIGGDKAPDLGNPGTAAVSLTPNAPGARLLTDQSNLARLQRSGAGVDQIAHPVDAAGNPTDQPVGFGRRLLSVLGHVGDIGLTALAPGVAALTPGTTLHNRVLQNQAEGRISEDEGELQKGAQLEQTDANTRLLDVQPQIKMLTAQNAALLNGAKIDHYGAQDDHLAAQNDNYAAQYRANLAKGGFAPDETDPTGKKLRPLRYEEMSQVQQATHDYQAAHTEEAEATAALKKAQNDPSSPAYRLALSRVQVAQQNARTAQGKLSLYGQSLDLRRENMNANLFGLGPDGQPIAGATQIFDDAGNGHIVGPKFAGAATKANANAGQFNDVHGALDSVDNAARNLVASGGSLNSPGVIAALTHTHDANGGWIHGSITNFLKGENAASLTPTERAYVQNIEAAHENVQALRKSVGGGVSDSQVNRLDALVPGATTPDLDYALGQTNQIRSTATRLGQGVAQTTGGLTIRRPAPAASGGSIPSAAAAHLQEGVAHTFGNGQVWTKQNGQAVRIK